jgi:serine phosphatase RsbU (regulator of sigma subunit)/anti-sigma regulatory factor (Ser/Thr protein kinase)
MAQTFFGRLRAILPQGKPKPAATTAPMTASARPADDDAEPVVHLAPNDPLVAYLQSVKTVVEVDSLTLDSPSVAALKQSGVKLVVPLINQGEFIGLITLGERLSEQGYSIDDRKLLDSLATQAAPAFRVANLVRQQRQEAQEREQIEQELRVARLIQQTLLPKEQLALPGWKVEAHYQPARAVGGDFYDFITLPDGRISLIIGDVTDKGVPAALVMAITRTLLRRVTGEVQSPGEILQRVNDGLCGDIPPKMFVTCFYAILDPATGKLVFANAGHDVPYRRTLNGVDELRARGMPLGLMPGMRYAEAEIQLAPNETVLFYTDGLVEAHNARREMFGFNQVKELMALQPGGPALVPFLLEQWQAFTGPDQEQEDDTTLIILQREAAPKVIHEDRMLRAAEGRTLAEFELPSAPGNERIAMRQVADAVAAAGLVLLPAKLERLKTAVAEATMNAIEHGNKNDPDKRVQVVVRLNGSQLAVHITDQGGNVAVPEPVVPDLDAKLAGLQSPRGWGLFLIQNMVDEMNVRTDADSHTVELIVNL